METIEQQYKGGGPPHHDASAQEIVNSSSTRSRIFVTMQEKTIQLSMTQTQEIFRHRHVLETMSMPQHSPFDRQALMKLGSLMAIRDIQGLYQLVYVFKCY